MMTGMALFWGALILVVILLVHTPGEQRPRQHGDSALDVLERRFAEGALSADEYHERRRVLAGSPHKTGVSP